MRLTEKIISELESRIASVRLIPSDGGRFEVTVNGRLLFSKLKTMKRAEADEIINLIKAEYGSKL